jgi:hypothetical protein
LQVALRDRPVTLAYGCLERNGWQRSVGRGIAIRLFVARCLGRPMPERAESGNDQAKRQYHRKQLRAAHVENCRHG